MSGVDIQGLIEGFLEAPEGHMDASMKPKFKALAENHDRKAVDLLRLLDECVYGSLCSDFSVYVLDATWQAMLKKEGKTKAQGLAEATWRNEGTGSA